MNKTRSAGVVLLCLGILFLVLGSVEFKTQEEVFRLGNLSATAATTKTIPGFRYVGVAALGAGFAMLALAFTNLRKD
jgi:hypothetical protein